MEKSKLKPVLGLQNRKSGELRGRLGVGPGRIWAVSGRSGWVRGRPPKLFGVDLFFSCPGRNKYETLSNKSLPSSSAETDVEYFFRRFFTIIFLAKLARPGLSAAGTPLRRNGFSGLRIFLNRDRLGAPGHLE